MTETQRKDQSLPPQHQDRQPGRQSEMQPTPQAEARSYLAAGKLKGRKAIVTGGDSGIGRAVAIMFAKEGADVAIVYAEEHQDAETTAQLVRETGRDCLLLSGDVGDKKNCDDFVARTVEAFGGLDILVNNAGEQHPTEEVEEISEQQLVRTFRTNLFGTFFMTQAALAHLKSGAAIVNCCSVTAYRGSSHLVDYAATKGALVSFTRSLSGQLVKRDIRVNGVAPGPIWTPLIPATFDAEHVAQFGKKVPMGRAGQPDEVGPCFVFLASDDASYMTGQILHPNGGEIVNT